MSVKEITLYSEAYGELRNNLKGMLPAHSLSIFDKDADALNSKFENILQLKVGDKAPDFTLSNAVGESIRLYDQLQTKRVILVFYRGTWCPYCNLALNHYQSFLTSFKEQGGELIAVSSQTPDESLSIKEKNNLDFEVLSDNGNLVAELFTTVFKNADAPIIEMSNLGFDFNSFYDDDSHEIPVPAVFVIEQDGRILFAKSEGGDYRNRTEAEEILEILKNHTI